MRYCGESLSNNNVPHDWLEQLRIIIHTLNSHHLFHNDLHIGNFILDENGKIYIIDFTWMDVVEGFPFININIDCFNQNVSSMDIGNFITDNIMSIKRLRYNEEVMNERLFSYKEQLNICNFHRNPEIFTVIIWDGYQDKEKTDDYLKEHLPIHFTILTKQLVTLTDDAQINLISSIYSNQVNRVVNDTIYLIILKDYIPLYENCKSTSCIQVLNKNMYTIKKDLRKLLGGTEEAYLKVHTSYNMEESLMVLTPLCLENMIPRISFKDMKHFFDTLNKNDKLVYIVQRSWDELSDMNNFRDGKDIDILTNDYYMFKNITGARSNNRELMRENDDGFYIQNNVIINNEIVNVDIRYIGDNYLHEEWQYNMLQNREAYYVGNIKIYIPNNKDILYSLLYNIYIQKNMSPSCEKHYQTIQNLLNTERLNEFNNINDYMNQPLGGLLDLYIFLIGHYDIIPKPKDICVGYNINKFSELENIIKEKT